MSSYTMNDEQFKVLVKAHSAVIAAGEDFRHLVCSLIPPDECRKTPEAKEDSLNGTQMAELGFLNTILDTCLLSVNPDAIIDMIHKSVKDRIRLFANERVRNDET